MIDRSYQLSNHAAYQLDQVSGLIYSDSSKALLIYCILSDWLFEFTCKMIDRSYQLGNHAAYQLDQVSGQI